MGLHISLGRESARGPYHVLYVGESAADAREAEAKSTLEWIIRLANPPALRKHNAAAEANRAAAGVVGEQLFGDGTNAFLAALDKVEADAAAAPVDPEPAAADEPAADPEPSAEAEPARVRKK